MNLLALDTATRHATVAICSETGVVAEGEREVTTHSEGLLSLIHETLEAAGQTVAEVAAVVCGRGPGSFTGCRIGLATAKGLCLAARKPLIGISSLLPLALAMDEIQGQPHGLRAAVLDARRGEVFCGLYRDGVLLEPEMLLSPEGLVRELGQRQEHLVVGGDGALLYQDVLLANLADQVSLAPATCHAIHARYLAIAARPRLVAAEHDDLATMVPLYLRSSDARLPSKIS